MGKNLFLTYDDFVKYRTGIVKSQMPVLDDTSATAVAEYQHLEFVKSLAISGIVPVGGTDDADALKQEDVISSVMAMEKTMEHFAPFWTSIHKRPAISDVVQSALLTSFNGVRRGGALDPSSATGGLTAVDPTLERVALKMGYLGGQFQVLRNALAIQAFGIGVNPDEGNAEQVASESRLQALIRNSNEMLWHGENAKFSSEPDGVLKQIRGRHATAKPTRINAGGRAMTQELLESGKSGHRRLGSQPTEIWAGTSVLADIANQLIAGTRYEPGGLMKLGNYADELLVLQLGGNPGAAKVKRDDDLDALSISDADGADTGAPTAPTTVTGDADTGADNVWGGGLAAGTYYYSVRAVGLRGRSAATTTGAVVVSSGDEVTLTITNAAQAQGTVKFFEIYRGDAEDTKKYLGRVAGEAVASAGTVEFVDNGEFVPGTHNVVSLYVTPEANGNYSVQARQLMPVLNVKLPDQLWARQGGWVLGMTPQLTKPGFHVLFENVGNL